MRFETDTEIEIEKLRKKTSLRIESLLRSEAYSSDGSMKENQSDNALHSSPPDR